MKPHHIKVTVALITFLTLVCGIPESRGAETSPPATSARLDSDPVRQREVWQKQYNSGIDCLKVGENALAEVKFAESLERARELKSRELTIKSLKSLAFARAALGFEHEKNRTTSNFSGADLVACIVILLLASSLLWLILKHGPQRPQVIDRTERWLRKAQTQILEDASTQFFSAMLSLFLFAAVAGALFLAIMSTMWLLSYMKERDKASETAIAFYGKAKDALQEASEIQGSGPVTHSDALQLYADFLNRQGQNELAALVERRAGLLITVANYTARIVLENQVKFRLSGKLP